LSLVLAPSLAWSQGQPVGPEFRVNTFITGTQAAPFARYDPSGNFVVVWRSTGQDGSGDGIFGQRYSGAGAPLGPEFRINTFTTSSQARASVATDPSGGFVVVWQGQGNQDGAGAGIFGQRFAGTGAPLGPEFRVNTYTTEYQTAPSVASDSAGNFVVAWTSTDQDGSSDGVYGQRYASVGVPLGPEFLVNTYTTSIQRFPSVASDAAGDFVVVWWSYQQAGSDFGVFGQRYAATGAPLGTEFRVNSQTLDIQAVSHVASDPSGNFVVVWRSDQQGGWYADVFGQRYASTGAPLGPEFRINTYTTSSQFPHAVASDAAGNFVVTWISFGQDDGMYSGVYAQRYASSGVALGPEFRANTFTPDQQGVLGSSVAADPTGNFVIVWDSKNQDGPGYGVYGQRYSPIVPVELMGIRIE
jgi:hypothetical protein